MIAGASKIDITPSKPVWMDGMIREHKSTGVHDPIFTRALVIAMDDRFREACAVVSVEVCGLREEDVRKVLDSASARTGISPENIIVAATHTHSGPATIGFFNPVEEEYLDELLEKLTEAVCRAAEAVRPVNIGFAAGSEDTISHYRRLIAEDGHVVMNWEQYPPGKIIGPLGEIDPEVGILALVDVDHPDEYIGILFNHAGHPNVMSGENYLISGDYAGLASRILEDGYGCCALFINGAQGTMDIDGLRDRDWEGVGRAGNALAGSVSEALRNLEFPAEQALRTGYARYTVPSRTITPEELNWAHNVLEKSDGSIESMADGVGDDYKALLLRRLHDSGGGEISIAQTCIAVDDNAFITFPGELFTEIGMRIKNESPFASTFILGLANGEIGYVPTRKAIGEGGYAVDTREAGNEAGEIIVSRSLSLLEEVCREL